MKFQLSLLIPILTIIIVSTQVSYSELDNLKESERDTDIAQNIIMDNLEIEQVDDDTVIINLYPKDFEIKNSETFELQNIENKNNNLVNETNLFFGNNEQVKSLAKSDEKGMNEQVKSLAKSDEKGMNEQVKSLAKSDEKGMNEQVKSLAKS
ncbi:MAG: hypothetical protein ACPKPY_10265, partial [Nitrososphaeraceae archaeon]